MSTETETPAVEEEVTKTPVVEVNRTDKLMELEDAWRANSTPNTEVEEPVTPTPEVVEETPPEVETPEEPEQTPQDDEFTKRFTQLTKMEKKLRERELKLKDFDSTREELNKFKELQTLAKQDPLAAANALGLSLNDLADQAISEDSFNERKSIDNVSERLKKLEDVTEQERKNAAIEEENNQARTYTDNINSRIDSAGDKYQLVRELNGGRQLVINTIAEWYQKSGEEMPWDKAAQMVENYLLDQKVKEFNHLTKIDKVRAKLDLSTQSPAVAVVTPTTKPVASPTITNSVASAPASKDVGTVTKVERERRIKELSASLFTE